MPEMTDIERSRDLIRHFPNISLRTIAWLIECQRQVPLNVLVAEVQEMFPLGVSEAQKHISPMHVDFGLQVDAELEAGDADIEEAIEAVLEFVKRPRMVLP